MVAEVCRISTKDKTQIILDYDNAKLLLSSECKSLTISMNYQHLHIVTETTILDDGDMIFHCGAVRKCTRNKGYKNRYLLYPLDSDIPQECLKKIIYTTDKSLALPIISDEFIEKYVNEDDNGNKILDIIIENDNIHTTQYISKFSCKLFNKIKINKNNNMNYNISKPSNFTFKLDYDENKVIGLIEDEIKNNNHIIDDSMISVTIPSDYITDEIVSNVTNIYEREWSKVNFIRTHNSKKFTIYLFSNN